ncbi:hypothetical protein CHS0354_026205 [Potamilus streckersoni]|uniref:Ly6/PLAUR domain-containing protein 6B n=1 Tax=Potamilus streckersoni TaxID=2493646 RepID=A0AAE0SFD4_9BIVA|nr:hypothetical protein CHS0354_026205 [Potamilus streckersoni]
MVFANCSSFVCLVVVVVMSSHVVSAFYVISIRDSTKDLTCYTCPAMTSNKECNKWAPDKFCPQNHTVCKTVHRINIVTGKSTMVDKSCAPPEHCNALSVGCHKSDIKNEMECVSCCGVSYCNEEIPFDHSMAVKLSTVFNVSSSSCARFPIVNRIATIIFAVVIKVCAYDLG